MRKDGAIKKMFLKIWEERPHVSEISGKPLLWSGNDKWHFQFAHILGKQAYPAYELNPDNIMLMTPEEHEKQESFPKYIERREELKTRYNQESEYSYGRFD